MNNFFEYTDTFKRYFLSIVSALVIFAVGWWLSGILCKMIKKAMIKTKCDLSIVSFSYSCFKCVFRIVTILIAMSALGINTSSIIAAFGASLVTLGLAMKDNLSNIASGVSIIINKPFKVGDCLEGEKFSGTVSKIELMFTTLVTSDNKETIIPNSVLTSSCLTNCSSRKTRKLDLSVPVKMPQDIDKVKSLVHSAVLENSNVLQDKGCTVYTESIEEGLLNIKIGAWCNTKDYSLASSQIKDEINCKILTNESEVQNGI